jgi:hypothetical protein
MELTERVTKLERVVMFLMGQEQGREMLQRQVERSED